MNRMPNDRHYRKHQLRSNKNTMASIAVQASQLSIAYSNSSSAFLSLTSARSSVASDDFEFEKDSKLSSIDNEMYNIRLAMPRFKETARSNAARFHRLKADNRELDGTNAALISEAANDPAASEKNSMMSSMKSANSQAADERFYRIQHGLY